MPAKKKRLLATAASASKKKPAQPPVPEPASRAASPPSTPPPRKYSALDAVDLVLRECGQPMSCPELIAQMAAQGYWTPPKGKTPSSTLYAALAREVKLKGTASRFIQTGTGRFAYRDSAERP
jgi:hypothetical protein